VKEALLELFRAHPTAAIVISLLVSLLVAIAGILPSVFVTAANIAFFGFWEGFVLSFLGEALGALISFLLYRKGFRKAVDIKSARFPKLQRLIQAEGREAFGLVLSLRLLPFVPSGMVTFAAAVGRISTGTFFVASTLGKIPALLLEAWSVYEVANFGLIGKLILTLTAIGLFVFILRRRKKTF
jgi:uncharacterized membrane protein YdjX (TVP38/TMEM64 family)